MDPKLIKGFSALTAERARELLCYYPETGELVWRISRGAVKAGAPIRSVNHGGYFLVRIDNRLFLAHRVIWLMQTGEWPAGCMDHINGIRQDNRWSNFRLLSNKENVQNQRRAYKTNSTGLLGAAKRPCNRFSAQIKADGVYHHLGNYRTAQEAHEAYVAAKRRLHQSCTL